MGTTPLRKNGCNPNKLTDKQRHFVLAYCIHHNGKQAALEAGYAESSASVTACTLLKTRNVKAMIGKIEGEQAKRFEIQRDEILMHLWSCATRDGKEFVDKDGHLLIDNMNDLPDSITNAIDSIKQKKRVYRDNEGNETYTEYELVFTFASKIAALRMAMEHKGLFAATSVAHTIQFPWDQLTGPPDATDHIEAKILDVESRAIEGNGHKSNGNGKKP